MIAFSFLSSRSENLGRPAAVPHSVTLLTITPGSLFWCRFRQRFMTGYECFALQGMPWCDVHEANHNLCQNRLRILAGDSYNLYSYILAAYARISLARVVGPK